MVVVLMSLSLVKPLYIASEKWSVSTVALGLYNGWGTQRFYEMEKTVWQDFPGPVETAQTFLGDCCW